VQGLAQSLGHHPWAWWAVVALGAYHGLNPGMGWLLAVSSGMQARRSSAVFVALPPIALGHFLAMAAALLPFTLLGLYLERLGAIRVAAGLLLVMFGLYKLASRRHPRYLARIGPSHLASWSFLMATAHGAGLIVAPLLIGLQHGGASVAGDDRSHIDILSPGGIETSALAITLHVAVMAAVMTGVALLVYRRLGLNVLRGAWINTDRAWAVAFLVAGAVALVT